MTPTTFDVEIKDQIAHLRMNRPDQLNSMTPAFWDELPALIARIDGEGLARVIVISSTGRHFTAGMDLAVFTDHQPPADADRGYRRAEFRQKVLRFQASFNAIEQARMPVLAAIQGGCIGGGVDLVTACDMRYATADAFFVIQEINIGMTADVGTLQRLPKLMPEGIVRELAYTGRRLPAAEAQALGLVNRVYDSHGALIHGVMEIAREIADRSPLAVWGSKEMLTYARDHSVADGLNYIATWNAAMLDRLEMAEAFRAKQEKRDPAYPDILPAPGKIAKAGGV